MAAKKSKADTEKKVEKQTGKKELLQRIDTLAAVVENLGIRHGDLKHELTQMGEAQSGMAETAAGLQRHLEGLAGRNGELERAVESAAQQARDAEKRLGDKVAGLASATQIEALQDGLTGQRQSDEQTRDALTTLTERLGVVESALGATGSRAEALQNQLATLAEREETLGSHSDAAIRRLDGLDQGLAAARQELEQIGGRLADAETARAEDKTLLELDERLSGFEQRLAGHIDAMHALERENEALRAQFNSVDGDLTGLRSDAAALGTRLGQLEGVSERIAGLEKQIAPLVQEQALQDESLQSLATQVNELNRSGQDAAEEGRRGLDELRAQLESIQRNLTGMDDHQHRLAEQVAGAEGNLQDLQGQAASLLGQIAELGDLARRVESVEGDLPGFDDRQSRQWDTVQALQGRVEAADEAARETTRRLADEVQRNDSLRKQIDAGLERLDTLEQAVSRSSRGLDDLVPAVATLEQAHKAASEETHQLREALDGRLDGLRRELDGLAENYGALSGQAREDGRHLEALQTRLEEVAGEVSELTARVAEDGARMESWKEEAGSNREMLQVLGQETEQQAGRIEALVSRTEELTETDRMQARRLEEVEERVTEQARKVNRLDHAVEENGEKFRGLETELGKAAAQLEELQQDGEENRTQMTSVRSNIRTLGWSLVAVFALLLVVAAAGWSLNEKLRVKDRKSLIGRMDLMEQRLATAQPPGNQEKVRELETEVAELRTSVHKLEEGSAAGKSPVPERRAAGQQEQVDDTAGEQGQGPAGTDELETETPPAATEGGEPPTGLEEVAPDAAPEPVTTAPAITEEPTAETEPETDTAPPVPDAPSTPGPWQAGQKEGHYTIQLLGVRERATLDRFVDRHQPGGDLACLETRYEGLPWFVLVQGVYPSRSQAVKALKALPAEFAGAWVRKLSASDSVVPLE